MNTENIWYVVGTRGRLSLRIIYKSMLEQRFEKLRSLAIMNIKEAI